MAERAAPPLVLIGLWARTSNLTGAGQFCALTNTRFEAPFFFFFFFACCTQSSSR